MQGELRAAQTLTGLLDCVVQLVHSRAIRGPRGSLYESIVSYRIVSYRTVSYRGEIPYTGVLIITVGAAMWGSNSSGYGG